MKREKRNRNWYDLTSLIWKDIFVQLLIVTFSFGVCWGGYKMYKGVDDKIVKNRDGSVNVVETREKMKKEGKPGALATLGSSFTESGKQQWELLTLAGKGASQTEVDTKMGVQRSFHARWWQSLVQDHWNVERNKLTSCVIIAMHIGVYLLVTGAVCFITFKIGSEAKDYWQSDRVKESVTNNM